MTKKILVLVDGSMHSDLALDRAIEIATAAKYELNLLHIVNTEDRIGEYSALPNVLLPQEAMEHLQDEGNLVLEAAKAKVPASIKVETFLEMGSPAGRALEFIETTKPDMAIIGSRGLGKLKRLLLGRVSRYLVENAPCPVMVVK